jgi:serine/threonine protein kinase
LEVFHERGYIHRDIKPENLLVGLGPGASSVYMIDFGLAKMYKSQANNQHIPLRTKKTLVGTARYASINTHKGIEQSRRDDLECLCYVLLYLLRGKLPWQGSTGCKGDRYKHIMDGKMATIAKDLCRGLPGIERCLSYRRAAAADADILHQPQVFRETQLCLH